MYHNTEEISRKHRKKSRSVRKFIFEKNFKKLHVKIQKNLIILINDRNFLESQAFFGTGRIYKRRRTKRETTALRKKTFSRKHLKKSRSVQKLIFGKK